MLLVCNDRAGVRTLIEHLEAEPVPASQLRLVRMRGRDGLSLVALHASRSVAPGARGARARHRSPPPLQLHPEAA